jgi:transcriptional regulator with GAF, ATPase, and Fis domain/ligand-binding sensor domain-containing protein
MFVITFLSNSFLVQAQGDDLIFEQIFLEQGLSQSIVKCILQDREGFMYFGTEDGLNRYDGYTFTVMRNNPEDLNSLSYNDINAMHLDFEGNIWIGTFNSGLNKYNPYTKKVTRFLHKTTDPNSISHDNINAICSDSLGIIWVGTDNGLNKLTPKESSSDEYLIERFLHQTINSNSISNNSIYALLIDRSLNLWLGTADGLNIVVNEHMSSEQVEFKHFKSDINDVNTLSNNIVRAIYEDSKRELWIGTDRGYNGVIKNSRGEILGFKRYLSVPNNNNSISHNEVYAINEDNAGKIWIGTNGGGLNLFDKDTESFTRYSHDPLDSRSLSYNEIRSLFKDRSGTMWIGTYGSGIDKVSRGAGEFILYKYRPDEQNSLSHPIVWSIYEDDDGILWIGTHGGGLNKLDRKSGNYTHYQNNPNDKNSLSNDIVRVVIEDSEGIFWIGTHGGGINEFNPNTNTFEHYQHDSNNPNSLAFDEIRSIYEDNSGMLWIGTYGQGLDKFNKANESFTHYKNDPNNNKSLSNNFVRTIYEDKSGNLWIGTEGGGLNKLDRASDTFEHFISNPDDSTSLSSDYIFTIHEDQDGFLWLGTWGGGLNRFNPKNKKASYFTADMGIPSNAIYGILEDEKGNLWLSSNNGISRFNPKTKSLINYNVKDGLQNNEFNGGSYFRSKSGEMFFGGINGFNSFYPNNIKDNTFIPPVLITSFQKFNREVEFDGPIYSIDQIDLSYGDYVFSFEFASLDFSAPEKNNYLYKMEGLDKDWISTSFSRRFATYTTLSPGDYIFKVKGSNSDGLWNETGASVNITIHPPFWMTWWFRTLVVVALVFAVFGLFKLRVKRLEEKRKVLSERLEDKTKHSIELQSALSEVERLKNRLEVENIYLQDEIKLQHNFENIITQSEEMKKVLHKIEQVSSTDATVLVLGESGTGKELLARAVHNISNRSDRPLVKVNCSALPANLIESELFGHEKGSFTGATSRKIGRFELADGGTIFLDEIGDLPLELQPKILRVLQEGEFERIGNAKTIKIDVRIIAATNRKLSQEIKNGNFREDLYYRLNVFPINIPPLRERKEDIVLLINYFVNNFSRKVGKTIETISQSMIDKLIEYNWPGNVRELENIIERAIITNEGSKLNLSEILPKSPSTLTSEAEFPTLEEIERQHIIKILQKTNWQVSGEKGAAKILGMKRTTLEARMKKLNIEKR